MTKRIKALGEWRTNGEMIAEVLPLFIGKGSKILEPTYGEGGFWKVWQPRNLVACDLEADKSPIGYSVDYRDLPFPNASFRAVVFDPPYKFNGKPDPEVDRRYGVGERKTVAQRWGNAIAGLDECVRVLKPEGYLFVKCQDQVVSGKVFFQVDEMTEWASAHGLVKVDYAVFRSGREQPTHRWKKCTTCGGSQKVHNPDTGRLRRCPTCHGSPKPGKLWLPTVQEHLDHNFSYLLVFQKAAAQKRRRRA